MAEETQAENIEVQKPVTEKGIVTFSVRNPPPAKLALVLKALRYFCTSLIALLSGSTVFTGNQTKYINFILSVFILFTGAIEIAVGVQPLDEIKKELAKRTVSILWFVCFVSIGYTFFNK